MLTTLLTLLALVLANGLLAGAALALVTSNRERLRGLADAGDTAAGRALKLAADPARLSATVQVGATLSGVLAAALGGWKLVDPLAARLAAAWPAAAPAAGPFALAAFVLAFAYLTLVVGGLVPKRLAVRHAERLARLAAGPLDLFARLTTPLAWGLEVGTGTLLWLVGQSQARGPTVSVDEIERLLETGRAEGVLEAVEQAVAAEALRLGERTVADIMRPRIDIDALDIDTPSGEVLGSIAMAGYSRLPVYEGSIDQIIGYVSIKDVLRTSWMGWPLELRKMLRRVAFVPETMPLDRLLDLFRRERTHFAIVLDEYGGTEGLVTLDDVLAELVGEIVDEHRREELRTFIERGDGSWLVDGGADVEELAERFGIQLPAEPLEYATVSGLVLAKLERMPVAGDSLIWEGLVIEVVDTDGRRIDKLLIRPAA
jgi:putative hemolysin